jgi:hypothetical protein
VFESWNLIEPRFGGSGGGWSPPLLSCVMCAP